MTPQEFCYWLQGMMEIQNPESLSAEQTQMVKDHLKLVFTKVTPEAKKEIPSHIKKAVENALEGLRRREKNRACGVVHVSDPWNRTYC